MPCVVYPALIGITLLSHIASPVAAQAQEDVDEKEAKEANISRALRALVAGGESAALVPIKRGDVVALSDRVVHGSGPNNSSSWRCVGSLEVVLPVLPVHRYELPILL